MADQAIVISDTHLRAALAQRTLALQAPGRLFAAIALDVHGGVEDILQAQGKPRWRKLSARSTIPARKERGTWPGKMLQESGRLAASIQPDSGDDFAQVSTNLPKARTLHFGARKGEFGRYSQLRVRDYARGDWRRNAGTINGFPLPWGDIPARPFMVITKDAKGSLLARTIKWLRGDGI